MFRKAVEWSLFSSVFIAICTVSLCIETNILLNVSLNSFSFYAFVFGASLVQYNFHYFIKTTANSHSARLSWSLAHRNVHIFLILFGIVLIMISLLSFHLKHFIFLVLLGSISFVYSFPLLPFSKKRIKDYGLMKIITLALMWTLVTVWFPIVESDFASLSFQLIFIRRFIFIFVLCLLFDIRDIPVDSAEHINTLPVRFGPKRSYQLAYFLLLIFSLLTVVHYFNYHDVVQFIAMFTSAITTGVVVYFASKYKGDLYYLAVVDGMMILQAFLVISGKLYLP
ncbi:hypothetical protein BH09BAC2_BH09BAC2_14060 [soil metagenome]